VECPMARTVFPSSGEMCIYGFFGTILGFIVSKKGNIPNPINIEVLVKMPVPKTP
jgi:hypothetical protein